MTESEIQQKVSSKLLDALAGKKLISQDIFDSFERDNGTECAKHYFASERTIRETLVKILCEIPAPEYKSEVSLGREGLSICLLPPPLPLDLEIKVSA